MWRWVFGLIVLAVLAGGAYWYMHARLASAPQSPTASSATPYVAQPLTQNYSNSTYGFSLMMPAGFAASESSDPDASSTTIVLQDQSGNGVQISVSPFSEDTGAGYTLTQGRIHQDLPDLEINDPQSVTVGPSYTGLAFLSDNPAFDGSSREVWFVFKGNLYQISTYARLDPLLQAIFKTWQFN